MSFQAMTWAVAQNLPCQRKMVLLMLANRHNQDTGRCDPSIQKLAEECGLSERSVQNELRELERMGLLEVIRRRIGKVNMPNAYRLNWGVPPVADEVDDADIEMMAGGGACGAPGGARRAPEPVIQPYISPSLRSGEKGARKRARPTTVERPEDVSDEVWRDWLTLRRAKKAPVTATVLKGARQEAKKAGMPLEAFLEIWCQRGSQGLKAEWLTTDKSPQTPGKSHADRSELDEIPFHQLSIADQCAARNRARRAERERAAGAIEAEGFRRVG